VQRPGSVFRPSHHHASRLVKAEAAYFLVATYAVSFFARLQVVQTAILSGHKYSVRTTVKLGNSLTFHSKEGFSVEVVASALTLLIGS
jgi:hypothetical protein